MTDALTRRLVIVLALVGIVGLLLTGCSERNTQKRAHVVQVAAFFAQPPAALVTITREVNRSMTWRADPPGDDRWQAGLSTGDCDDFVMEKRRRLLAAGIQTADMLVLVTVNADRVAHARLLVRSENGVWTLDNLTDRVRAWDGAGIVWQVDDMAGRRLIQADGKPLVGPWQAL
jgi:predicted transglutaminase-like cysteine proteinase